MYAYLTSNSRFSTLTSKILLKNIGKRQMSDCFREMLESNKALKMLLSDTLAPVVNVKKSPDTAHFIHHNRYVL